MDKNNKKQAKNQLNSWIKFTNIGLQMAIVIAAGVFLGVWLDEKYSNNASTFTIIFSLLGVFAALYNVYRQVKDLGKD
ncbi:AtpZ/AtpI family protein [Galbibacter mesophilus]|uniref:AtpZ/AtpI family protein n=1 Tax=Galbibacter mesophilus TaxID=379069 RepID=UPI00191CF6EB|nr:AtpZ/AtpI family protein [Galbibacter mesophilus]MCM5662386.1 AtpZ/AtpI family protein [Galbibacter mesophilus]